MYNPNHLGTVKLLNLTDGIDPLKKIELFNYITELERRELQYIKLINDMVHIATNGGKFNISDVSTM